MKIGFDFHSSQVIKIKKFNVYSNLTKIKKFLKRTEEFAVGWRNP